MDYSEATIIEGIIQSSNKVFKHLYIDYYPMVRHLVLNNNGTEQDAEEIFQESIMVLFERLRGGQLKLSCTVRTYLYSVSRNLWLQQLEWSRRHVALNEQDTVEAHEDAEYYEDRLKIRKRIYQKHFLMLTTKCQRILELFLMNLTFDQIAKVMGFSDRQYAIKRKYECTKSLLSRIYNDPYFKKYFK